MPTLIAVELPFTLRSLMIVTVSPSYGTLPTASLDHGFGVVNSRFVDPLVRALGAHQQRTHLVGVLTGAGRAGRKRVSHTPSLVGWLLLLCRSGRGHRSTLRRRCVRNCGGATAVGTRSFQRGGRRERLR